MENASKAILIAGAVIIAIAVISIAVTVYVKINEAMTSIDLDTTAISTHNSRFTQYVGEVTGSQVKICLSNVLANNYNDNTLADFKMEVSITDATLNASLPADRKVTNSIFEYIKFDNAEKTGSGKKNICDNMSEYIKTNYIYIGTVTYNKLGVVTKIEFLRK